MKALFATMLGISLLAAAPVSAESAHEHQAEKKASKAEANATYTCPMHPKVVQKGPGKCPDCGMFLEPVKSDANATHTCPMHPKVVQKGPGKCPDCGMFLEPVKAAPKK